MSQEQNEVRVDAAVVIQLLQKRLSDTIYENVVLQAQLEAYKSAPTQQS